MVYDYFKRSGNERGDAFEVMARLRSCKFDSLQIAILDGLSILFGKTDIGFESWSLSGGSKYFVVNFKNDLFRSLDTGQADIKKIKRAFFDMQSHWFLANSMGFTSTVKAVDNPSYSKDGVTFMVSPEVSSALAYFRRKFESHRVQDVLNFRSNYSVLLLEYMHSVEYLQSSDFPTFTLGLERLKNMFGIEKKYAGREGKGNFQKKVLDAVVLDLNRSNNSRMVLEYRNPRGTDKFVFQVSFPEKQSEL